MTLWDDINALLYPVGSTSLYKDKKTSHQRTSSKTSGSEGAGSTTSSAFLSAAAPGHVWSAARPPRLRILQSRFCRYLFIIAASFTLVYLWRAAIRPYSLPSSSSSSSTCSCGGGVPPVSDTRARAGELADALQGFKHRGDERCNVSSLDLHRAFGEVCADRRAMLAAMSGGGRVGRDAPYLPRGCDMRWFTTEEACEILGRFGQVVLVGDSMLRHVMGALNVLIREDLGYGGVTDWNFNDEERRNCFCNNQFDVRDCSVQGIFSTADVLKHDPMSLVCPRIIPHWSTDLRIEQMVRYPIPKDEQQRLERAIDADPARRKAFVLGHGLWNDLKVEQSTAWTDTVLEAIEARLRLRMRLRSGGSTDRDGGGSNHLPVLLVTPNAAGDRKPDEWIVSQGNKALVRFERAMAAVAERRRIDHLGTWNMSVQATLYDGVHMDMRGNLLKAMMVLNWLNLLED
ncbi:hypothetical protein F5X99DRAFT_231020 [Biscogniauxia marginata]|nr:hypothetical protein F5X99DRAFT_231020 [Biscogniauxia marginata]